VLYAPTDPSSARLRGEGQDSGPAVSAGFALTAALLVVVVVRLRRRPDPVRPGTGPARAGAPASAAVAD